MRHRVRTPESVAFAVLRFPSHRMVENVEPASATFMATLDAVVLAGVSESDTRESVRLGHFSGFEVIRLAVGS